MSDKSGQVVTVIDPTNDAAETRTYSPNGKLTSTEDADDNVTDFQWDGFDRLAEKVYPDASTEQFTFDANSNVLSRQTRNGDTIVFTYDPLNRAQTKQPTGLPLQTMGYDLAGRLTSISTPVVSGDPTSGTFAFSFDTAGRLVQQTTPASQNVTYQLDANGNRTQLMWPDGYFVDYAFDALNRLTDILLNGSSESALQFSYDTLSRRIGLAYDNGCEVTYSYWLNDDLSMLSQNFVGSAVSFTFGYNRVHQLTNTLVSDDTFLWNPTAGSLAVYGPANNLNQYPDVGVSYSYDLNGCLTADGVNSYSYDSLSRLTGVSTTSLTNSYLYDPLNRQGQKVVTNNLGPVTANYLYDLGRIIADYDGTGALQNRYIRGTGADELLISVDASGDVTFVHGDRIGSVIAQTDDTGAVINTYQYSPFGETPALNDSIFGYTGQKYDAEFALYSYKARYYSPQIGRFLQPDPIGYLAGDLNLYSYVSNDPLNHTDPSGQAAITDVWTPVLQFIVDVIRDVVVTAPPPVNGGGTGPGDKPAIASPGVAGTPVNGPGSQPGVVYATGPGEGSGTGPSDSSEPEQPQPPQDPEPPKPGSTPPEDPNEDPKFTDIVDSYAKTEGRAPTEADVQRLWDAYQNLGYDTLKQVLSDIPLFPEK